MLSTRERAGKSGRGRYHDSQIVTGPKADPHRPAATQLTPATPASQLPRLSGCMAPRRKTLPAPLQFYRGAPRKICSSQVRPAPPIFALWVEKVINRSMLLWEPSHPRGVSTDTDSLVQHGRGMLEGTHEARSRGADCQFIVAPRLNRAPNNFHVSHDRRSTPILKSRITKKKAVKNPARRPRR
jgi:hypothetical protein